MSSLFTPVSTRRRIVLKWHDHEELDDHPDRMAAAEKEKREQAIKSAIKKSRQAPVVEEQLPPQVNHMLKKYQSKLMRTCFLSWKSGIGEHGTRYNNKRLVLKFLCVAPLPYHNSFQQLELYYRAENAMNLKHYRLGWNLLYSIIILVRRIELMVPMANQHFALTFIKRVGVHIFKAILKYSKYRKLKRLLKLKGDAFRRCFLHRIGYIQLQSNAREVIQRRVLYHKGLMQYIRRNQSLAMKDSLLPYALQRRYYRDLSRVSSLHHNWWNQSQAIAQCIQTTEQRIQQRNAALRGIAHYEVNTMRNAFADLRTMMVLYRARLDQMRRYYRTVQLRKAMVGFKLNAHKSIEAPQIDTNAPLRTFCATLIQARWRGLKDRAWVRKFRVHRIISVLVIQRQIRVYLAKKRRYAFTRHRFLIDHKREQVEERAMWQEDLYMQHYMYQEREIIKIQRCFRGYLGREIFRIVRIEASRNKGVGFYNDIKVHLEIRRRYLAEEPMRMRIRTEAAIMIQKHVRGMLGKGKAAEQAKRRKIANNISSLQRIYRAKLAKRKLNGLRRAKVHAELISSVFGYKGFVLRCLGYKHRKQQRRALESLSRLGLHPSSFEHKLKELVKDTVIEGAQVMGMVRHYCKNWIARRLNREPDDTFLLLQSRQAEAARVQLHDAVRICEVGHPYSGYTGQVVRVDAGNNLYEVMLDKQQKVVYIVVRSDAANRMFFPSLQKIEQAPKARIAYLKPPAFPVEVSPPEYSKKRTIAAWRIQMAWRRHLAHLRVTGRRFDVWKKEIDRHKYGLQLMAELNATSAANVDALQALKFQRDILLNDYLRHPPRPPRFNELFERVLKPEEAIIAEDYEDQFKRRADFILKSDLAQITNYFSIGTERLTMFRRMAVVFWKDKGLVMRPGHVGGMGFLGMKGLINMKKRNPIVSGTERFCFPQLVGSKHVRYDKLVLYQGEWGGLPFITPFKPHGEGLVIFMNAWKLSKSKVLYLTISKCYLLPVAPSHGVFCAAYCGGQIRRTETKYKSVSPEFHENFEIDVADPTSILSIEVLELGRYFNSEDIVIGKIQMLLKDLSDGHEHKMRFDLKGEYFYDKFTEKEKNLRQRQEALTGADKRGHIEVKLQWTDRLTSDDRLQRAYEIEAAIVLQKMARSLLAKKRLAEERVLRQKMNARVHEQATKLASLFRRRIAQRKLRVMKRNRAMAIKVQCRVRIHIAKEALKLRKKKKACAIKIQALIRGFLERRRLRRAAAERNLKRNISAAFIQRNVRRWIGNTRASVRRKFLEIERGIYCPEPIEHWISTYGRDPEYSLRRNRRITYRALQRMLHLPYCRVVSRFGVVYIETYSGPRLQYPVQPLDFEQMEVHSTSFMRVFLPTFIPDTKKRNSTIELLLAQPFYISLHVASSVNHRATVAHFVIMIQCVVRRKIARRVVRLRRRLFRFLQRFKNRFIAKKEQAMKIFNFMKRSRVKAATRKVIAFMRLENRCALRIQCAIRCSYAREALWERRRVPKLKVFNPSGALPAHGIEYVNDGLTDTYWMVDSIDVAEFSINLSHRYAVAEVAVMTSTYAGSPQFVTICTYGADKMYHTVLAKTPMALYKKRRWQRFPIAPTVTKYVKLIFEGNFGDPDHIAVRGVAVIRAKERSAKVLEHPVNHLIETGPSVGTSQKITLQVKADGWPEPSYQWYFNGQPMVGETRNSLEVNLLCPKAEETRKYRCIRCKMRCFDVSTNMYAIECGNCNLGYTYPEISEYDTMLEEVRKDDALCHDDRKATQSALEYLANATYSGHLKEAERLKGKIKHLDEQIIGHLKGRFYLKQSLDRVNNYQGEGFYYCAVSNIRGGAITIIKCSEIVTIVVEKPQPHKLKMIPWYEKRKRMLRRIWGIYKSMLGNFLYGNISGIVSIRFEDGAIYEGPYVEDRFVDGTGAVDPAGRSRDHHGYYTCTDGRIFEGTEVDNHFSPKDITGCYKLTVPGTFVYQGEWCDNRMHGHGLCVYESGDVYEGRWHQNARFGYGRYSSMDGWVYDGEFNQNQRHGQGTMRWSDGGYYIGEWHRDKRCGKGILVTRILDVYRGEFDNDDLCGFGHMLYSNGGSYLGQFVNSNRHGRGKLVEKDGTEYYGEFINDAKCGDFVVKCIVGTGNERRVEIRIGSYKDGELVEWKRIVNKQLTDDFIDLFYQNRSNFDSIYSLLVAKHLPEIPVGLDPDNREVQLIIERIRLEGGNLVSELPLKEALEAIKLLLQPIRETSAAIDSLSEEVKNFNYKLVLLGFKKKKMYMELRQMEGLIAANKRELEHYWMTEPTHSRRAFLAAVAALQTVPKTDYQFLKTHHVPPQFIKGIMDAICLFLDQPLDWGKQRLLLSDNHDNVRDGDAEGLIHEYDCKLAHLFSKFDIVDHYMVDYTTPHAHSVMNSLADPRYNRDSFYIESCGAAAPALVDVIKATMLYVNAAKRIRTTLLRYSKEIIQCSRMKVAYNLIEKEYAEAADEVEKDHATLTSLRAKLAKLHKDLEFADDFAKHLNDVFRGKERELHGLDYYQRLELAIEAKVDTLAVESCMESLLMGVEERIADERHLKAVEARALDLPYHESVKGIFNIKAVLQDQVVQVQDSILATGVPLGSVSIEPNALPKAEEDAAVKACAREVIRKINEFGNEDPATAFWIMLKGKKISIRCIYVSVWEFWRKQANAREAEVSIREWEKVFIEPEVCARRAIEAKWNFRMTAKVKRQALHWFEGHPSVIKATEWQMANEFESEHPKDAAEVALQTIREDPRKVNPSYLAQVYCWNKVNPSEARDALEKLHLRMSNDFHKQFGSEAPKKAVALLNNLNKGDKEESPWREHALQWRTTHTEEYYLLESNLIAKQSAAFFEMFPEKTHLEAARVVINDGIGSGARSRYPDIPMKFIAIREVYDSARCWGMKNQLRMENGMALVHKEFAVECERLWQQLLEGTEKFKLGSRLFVEDEANDSFAEFRGQLIVKNIWLVGYLLDRHGVLLAHLDFLRTTDPLREVVDINVRPSTLKQLQSSAQSENVQAIEAAEKELVVIIGRISAWNSYFGI